MPLSAGRCSPDKLPLCRTGSCAFVHPPILLLATILHFLKLKKRAGRRRGVFQAVALQRITDIEKSFKGFERQLSRKWIYFRFESPLSGLCPDLADQQQQGVPGKQFQEESQFNLPLIVISTGKECEEPGNFCRCRCNKFYGGHHWPISAEEGGWMSAVKAVTLICNKPLPKDVFSVSWRVVKSSSSGFIFRYNLTVVSVGTAHHRSPWPFVAAVYSLGNNAKLV